MNIFIFVFFISLYVWGGYGDGPKDCEPHYKDNGCEAHAAANGGVDVLCDKRFKINGPCALTCCKWAWCHRKPAFITGQGMVTNSPDCP